MYQIDLHTHTTFSDGTYTPEELVSYAAEKKLKAIAITDHDTTKALELAIEASKKINSSMEIINGIEISTKFKNREIHILGLFLDKENKELKKFVSFFEEKRNERNLKMLEKLNSINIDINMQDLISLSKSSIIARPHFARVLLKKGYVTSIDEAFDKYIGCNKIAYIEKEMLYPDETISMLKAANAIPILAHPLLYNFGTDLENYIKELKALGLQGMECIYTTHSEEDTKNLIALAENLKLKVSGGSDFHGENKPKLDLGSGYGKLFVPYSILEKLKEV